MNNKINVRSLIFFNVATLIIASIWSILVIEHTTFVTQFDNFFINLIANHNQNELTIFRIITKLGNTSIITIFSIIIVIVLLIIKKYYYALYTALTMITASATTDIIKDLVQRPRPSVHHLVYAGGFSYPSGHSSGSMALFGVLIVLTYFLIKNKNLKMILYVILGLLIISIGISRIYLHVHYPSDVLGGYLISAFYASFWLLIFRKKLIVPKA